MTVSQRGSDVFQGVNFNTGPNVDPTPLKIIILKSCFLYPREDHKIDPEPNVYEPRSSNGYG